MCPSQHQIQGQQVMLSSYTPDLRETEAVTYIFEGFPKLTQIDLQPSATSIR